MLYYVLIKSNVQTNRERTAESDTAEELAAEFDAINWCLSRRYASDRHGRRRHRKEAI